MRIKAPQEPFEVTFGSADGPYTLKYSPLDEWDGRIAMVIRGVEVGGDVLQVDDDPDGRVFMGPTTNFSRLYNDEFWFELRPDRQPAVIEFFGDRVLWRSDTAT